MKKIRTKYYEVIEKRVEEDLIIDGVYSIEDAMTLVMMLIKEEDFSSSRNDYYIEEYNLTIHYKDVYCEDLEEIVEKESERRYVYVGRVKS